MDSRDRTPDASGLRNAVRRAHLALSRLVDMAIRRPRAARTSLQPDEHPRDDLGPTCAYIENFAGRHPRDSRIRPTGLPFGWLHDSHFRR